MTRTLFCVYKSNLETDENNCYYLNGCFDEMDNLIADLRQIKTYWELMNFFKKLKIEPIGCDIDMPFYLAQMDNIILVDVDEEPMGFTIIKGEKIQ